MALLGTGLTWLNQLIMDYFRRSARVSRLQWIMNEEIRRRMEAEETVLERIDKRGLKWFGDL